MSYMALKNINGELGVNIFVLDTSDNTIGFLTAKEYSNNKVSLGIVEKDYDFKLMEIPEFTLRYVCTKLFEDSNVKLVLGKSVGQPTAVLQLLLKEPLRVVGRARMSVIDHFVWGKYDSNSYSCQIFAPYATLLLNNDEFRMREVERILDNTFFVYEGHKEIGYRNINQYIK